MINLNQCIVSLEYRIESESTFHSFEHGFLSDINSVCSLYEEDEGERGKMLKSEEREKVKAFQEYS